MSQPPLDRGASLGRLMALIDARALKLESDPPDRSMSESCEYEWQLSTIEVNTRIDVTLDRIHATPEQAFADAADFYDSVLACGFYAFARTELMAVRVGKRADGQDEWLGWRGRVDAGLRVNEDPRGMRWPDED